MFVMLLLCYVQHVQYCSSTAGGSDNQRCFARFREILILDVMPADKTELPLVTFRYCFLNQGGSNEAYAFLAEMRHVHNLFQSIVLRLSTFLLKDNELIVDYMSPVAFCF